MLNKKKINDIFDYLFPICRSISGSGYRKSIEYLKKFIPLKKVLKVLDISRVTADTWHRQGLLTKYYKGSRVYYLTKDIDNLLPSSN